MADPITVLRSIASLNTIEETTMMMTLLAVFKTDEVTAPTWLVNAKAKARVEYICHKVHAILKNK